MNTKFKATLEEAISKSLNDHCEDEYWDYFIHPTLVRQMTDAAEVVFDAAQAAQEYYQRESQ